MTTPPVLKVVVLAIADKQNHVDIGFQREGYADGVVGNLQPEREISTEERRGVNRPPTEADGLSGRERAAAGHRRRSLSVELHFRRERAVDLDARSKDSHRYEVGSGS